MYKITYNGKDLEVMTEGSLFSPKEADKGTLAMLRHVSFEAENKVLDLGCGYGPIGIIMKRVFPSMEVTMVDINHRAIELAKQNAEANSVKCVDVHPSDGCASVEGLYDVILTNPPVRAGKQTVFSFYDGAYEHMAEGAFLYVVLQKKQGAPSSEKYLIEKFGNCEVIAKESGYWIMKSVKA